MKHVTQQTAKQEGLVSIVVTVTIMFILSILVIGFARTTRREQVQVLDRQLNTQAFYAAESGVNDAVNRLNNTATPLVGYTEDQCIGGGSFIQENLGGANTLDSADVAFTCLLVDESPTSLEYRNIGQTTSKVFPIRPTAGSVNTVEIYWESSTGGTNTASCPGNFPPSLPAGCDVGVLRLDLVPTGGGLTKAGLVSGTRTVFLYPGSGAGSGTAPAGFPNQGGIITGDCSGGGPRQCRVEITGLGATEYTARIKSIYRDSSMVLTVNGGGTELVDAQALIDSTGKAVDVLRRIQVRVSLRDSVVIPEFALEAVGTICKQFAVAPPSTVVNSAGNECNPRTLAF